MNTTRSHFLRAFLWLSIAGWGIGLGGKLFDLLVVARAWGAHPPDSLSLMPYGDRFPINPGDFFQLLSVVMAVSVVGALIAGWKTRWPYREWLLLPVIAFVIIWAATPTIFWPIIHELYGTTIGRTTHTDTELVRLIHRWVICDWVRVGLIAIGFISSVRAISLPIDRADMRNTGIGKQGGFDGSRRANA